MPATIAEDGDRTTRSSLSKALALLTVVASYGKQGVPASEAARRAGVHGATGHRLLSALVAEDFLSFDPYTKLYHLGIMPYEMVANAGADLEFLDLRKKLRPVLEEVQARCGGIVSLSVPSRGEALCIDVVIGRSDISINTLKVGARRPLGAGAASLALLAALPAAEREKIICAEASRYPHYGRLTAEIVREACNALPRDGYVLNNAMIIPDIGAMAVPVFLAGELVAAVSVSNTISLLSPARRRAEIAGVMAGLLEAAAFQTKMEP